MRSRSKSRTRTPARPTQDAFFDRGGSDPFFAGGLRSSGRSSARPATLQRQATGGPRAAGGRVPPQVESAIRGQRGGGERLAEGVRGPMERAVGTSLEGVRLHTDAKADELTRSLGARAFTAGRDVFFRRGETKPASREGLRLLAHELTHVAQQSRSRAKTRSQPPPSDANGNLADSLREALEPETRSSAAPDLQRTLTTDLRQTLGVYGPVYYEGAVRLIRAASVAERQAAVVDRRVLQLIRTRLNPTYGSALVSELLVGSQNWDNPPASDFYNFFMVRRGQGAMPLTQTMNCWESIMYAAHLSGQLSANWIRSYYTSAGALPGTTVNPTPALWRQLGFSTSLPIYSPAAGRTPTVGQLVFYLPSGAPHPSHVAVYVGSGEVISLWTKPHNIHTIQRISITAISGTIHYADPPW